MSIQTRDFKGPLAGQLLDGGLNALSKEDRLLFDAVSAARENAWAFYTNYSVAAGIRADNGRIYLGVNLECAVASDGQTASRTALGSLVTAGARGFQLWMLVGQGDAPCIPAGGDLQLAAEFASEDAVIACCNQDGSKIALWRVLELLPHAFSYKHMVSGRAGAD